MTQLTFADAQLTMDDFQGVAPHIVDSFLKFHETNPKVYSMFKIFACQLRQGGLSHYGSKAIMERIRWHFEVEHKQKDFKVNNNYASCYARLLMREAPEFKGFFELRNTYEMWAA